MLNAPILSSCILLRIFGSSCLFAPLAYFIVKNRYRTYHDKSNDQQSSYDDSKHNQRKDKPQNREQKSTHWCRAKKEQHLHTYKKDALLGYYRLFDATSIYQP